MYYDGELLSDNFLSRRRKARREVIVSKLKSLDYSKEGVSTNDLWMFLVKDGYHYDVRTLSKDLAVLEVDGLVVGKVVFGGKGKGTIKFWRIV